MSQVNGTPTEPPQIDYSVLMAKIEVCVINSALALKEATRAREAAEESRDLYKISKSAVGKIASDHLELKSGFPVKWKRRIALTAFAASVGSISSCVAMASMRYFIHWN